MQQELRIVMIYGSFCCTQTNWIAISVPNMLVPLHLQCNTWLEHPDPRTGRVPFLGLSSSHSSSCWHTDLWPGSPASVLQMPREGPSKGRSSAELPVEITPVIEHLHATGWAVGLEGNRRCPTYLQEEAHVKKFEGSNTMVKVTTHLLY